MKYPALIATEHLLHGTALPELNVCTLQQLKQNVLSVRAAELGSSSPGAAGPCGTESHSPAVKGRARKNTSGHSLPDAFPTWWHHRVKHTVTSHRTLLLLCPQLKTFPNDRNELHFLSGK